MLTHGDRHLPCVQRPHTRGPHTPNTRSLTHPCLTHADHTTHTHGGTHPRCFTHAWGFTHTRAVSRAHVVSSPCGAPFAQGGSHTRAVLLAPAASSACGAPFTHGVPGSTHVGTPVTTPLAHGVSRMRGVSALGVSLAHGASRTQRLSLPACVRRSTHFNTLVYAHRDTTHTGTTFATAHTGTLTLSTTPPGTLTLGTTLTLASTRAPGVFTPPKLCVHPSAALTSSTSRGTTEFPWS